MDQTSKVTGGVIDYFHFISKQNPAIADITSFVIQTHAWSKQSNQGKVKELK